MNDGGETWLSQDNIGGTASGVSSTLDGDADIGAGQSGGIIGTITGHSTKVTETLETLHDLVLVFGEDTSEAVRIQNHFVEGSVPAARSGTVLQDLCGVHMVTQAKTTSSLLRNSELVTGNHLDPDTESNGIVDGLLGIVTGGIENGEETDELETVAFSLVIIAIDFLESNGQGTETAHGEFLDVGFKPVLDVFGFVTRAKLDNDTGHALGDALELAGGLLTVGALGTLVDGVKWLEVEDLDTGMSSGGVREGTDDTGVNSILVFGTGSVGSQLDDILYREGTISPDCGTIDGELVGGEGTGLI